jgi:hypothetical protein
MRLRGISGISRLNAALNAVMMLAVLAVWALVPQGYMLAGPADGRLMSVELCSSGGHAVLLDLDTGKIVQPTGGHDNTRQQPGSTASKSCPFATVPLGLTAPLPVQIAMAAQVGLVAWDAPAEVRDDLAIIAGVPWPTGPPQPSFVV